ncbi:hypothetical protein [Duganella fentianensis]|uniref:hypothetical protein n=1 Tax=Duganella fentianensis TaxID=2692177 RepID=UPI0032B2231E
MQATIYVSAEAMATVNAISNLDYYDRVSLGDDPATDLNTSPGYYLNTNALHLAELPVDADVAIHITPADPALFGRHVSIPANLRGPIFSGAPNLPLGYAEKIAHWSPLTPTAHHRGAVYYQNVLNAYCVNLTDSDEEGGATAGNGISDACDILLSDGIVVVITGLAETIANMASNQYIALTIPINTNMLGIELDGFRTAQEYLADPVQQTETLYLRVSDVQVSPDADMIIISAIRSELADYGYTY